MKRRIFLKEASAAALALPFTGSGAHGAASGKRIAFEPARYKIVVVKAGYLVPEIAKIATPNLMALTPGAINQDIEHLPKNRYRVPTYPFVPDLQWNPNAIVGARSPRS